MKVAALLSGGVDSSVALNLVQRQGEHAVTAFYLKVWLEDDAFLGDCPWEEDLAYARAVCEQAGVPLKVIPLQSEYQETIVEHVLRELEQGRTPSPDILCNQQIKFGCFFERIGSEFDKVVTGHYARITETNRGVRLERSPDPVKDQTYFLYALSQQQLRRLWFPIGHLTKAQVRELAHQWDLPNRDRKDSQGICFLGKIHYSEFVRHHLGERPGDMVEWETGRRIARHRGLWFHTIGQRKGLGLSGGPWYVVDKDIKSNRLYISHSESAANHARKRFVVHPVHWIEGPPERRSLQTKIRHTPDLQDCELEPLDGGRWSVRLADQEYGVAPGQSAIFYDGNRCLGGGVIESGF